MTLWLDIHLSPAVAKWVEENFNVPCYALRDVGHQRTEDEVLFETFGDLGTVIVTKDSDFIRLVNQHGPPPQVLWLTCGNTTNAELRRILGHALHDAVALLAAGEPIVEIRG